MSVKTTKRVVGVLSAIYFTPGEAIVRGETQTSPHVVGEVKVLTAGRGEEIELTESEERRLDGIGALLPAGSTSQDAQRHLEARLDAYRAQRGDLEAMQRHQQRLTEPSDGGIVDVEAPVDGSVEQLAAYIRDQRLTVDDTVALAEDDPARARRVLEAEHVASENQPRSGVQQRLAKLIEG